MMARMAKPKKNKSGNGRPARIEVKIDRALKQAWERSIGRLERGRREGAGAFDEVYESADEIARHVPPLFLAGGISTVNEFVRVYLKEPLRTAMRNMRVARYASPAEETRYTPTKLDAALGYIEAKIGARLEPGGRLPIAFDKLRFDVERSGQKRRVGLDEATVQDINAATRALTKADRKPPAKASPDLLALARALDRRALAKVTKRIAHGNVWLGAIPMAHWQEFVRALGRVKFAAPK